MDHPPESLTIRPAPNSWRQLLRLNTSPDAAQIRRELNLPTDRPIIMSGHHPAFWHPGVLAKYLAADIAAATFNAHPAWLFVDQDRAESVELRYPVHFNGELSVGTATVKERKLPATNGLLESLTPRIQHIRAAFEGRSTSPTLAHQLAATLSDLIRPYLALPHATNFATTLSHTTQFQSLVRTMAHDPESCITAYNAAAARHPTAGIRPLTASEVQDRWELPLWHLPPGKPRKHVYAEDLPNIPIHELAPKALFMTGLMRLAACDLFIHGLGAAGDDPAHEGYDIITEEWLERWLGIPRASIAPMALVTATRYLPLSDSPPPTAADIAGATWIAHHARHEPSLLNDPGAAAAKEDILARIAMLPRRTTARADAFRELHTLLDTSRRSHAEFLDSLDRHARELSFHYAERHITYDRTWPFFLYPESTLTALCNEIRSSFLAHPR